MKCLPYLACPPAANASLEGALRLLVRWARRGAALLVTWLTARCSSAGSVLSAAARRPDAAVGWRWGAAHRKVAAQARHVDRRLSTHRFIFCSARKHVGGRAPANGSRFSCGRPLSRRHNQIGSLLVAPASCKRRVRPHLRVPSPCLSHRSRRLRIWCGRWVDIRPGQTRPARE